MTVPIRAGQVVRVVDSNREDDGIDYTPTIRTDGGVVHVSALYAATPVRHVPNPDQIRKLFHRSADDVAFWNSMIAAPDEDLPRLIYADYLDERGDPAGAIVRDSAPFILQYSVLTGQEWEERNRRRVSWRNAIKEFCALTRQGASEFGPGYSLLSLSCFVDWGQHRAAQSDGEWRCLILCDAAGKRPPPFVNYLLLQLAISLMANGAQPTPAGSVIARNVVEV
jgi:uncharacterized protein (TIGR02996 family)